MNSRKNHVKRVAAGALAVLTVAAYTTPVANVGGLLNTSLVAEAATVGDTRVQWEEALSAYLTSITDGTYTAKAAYISTAESFKLDAGKVATIMSSVPLNFKATVNGTEDKEFSKSESTTIDLTKKTGENYDNGDKYIETLVNNVYTYKVLVQDKLTITGQTTSVTLFNKNDCELERADGSKIKTVRVTDTFYVNGKAADASVIKGLIKKSKAVVSSDEAFELYVKPSNTAMITKISPSYNSKSTTGKYEVKFDVPTDVGGEVYINKITPNFTFKNNGTSVTASDDIGATTNAVAASVTATYQAKVKMNKDELEDYNDKHDPDVSVAYKYDTAATLANNGKAPNGSAVILEFKNDGKLTSESSDGKTYVLKITKDGKEVDANTEIAFTNVPDANTGAGTKVSYNDGLKSGTASGATPSNGKLVFTQTGKYTVEYTVYTTTKTATETSTQAQKMTYNFEIKTKDLLTADNVQIVATAKDGVLRDGKKVDGATDYAVEVAGIEDGVAQIVVSDAWKNSDQIQISAKIFENTELAGNQIAVKSITGNVTPTVLNQVNTLTIAYNNPEYSANDQAITVKYKLVPAKKAIVVTPNEDYKIEHNVDGFGAKPYFSTTVDEIATVENDVLAALNIKNAEGGVQFEYVKGYGADIQTEELDYHEAGLPKTAGEYSVFVVYEDDIVAAFNMLVSEHSLYAAPSTKQLNITYGTKAFTGEDIKYVDANGKTVADAGVSKANITYKAAVELEAADIKKITADNTFAVIKDGKTAYVPVFTKDGKKYIEGDAIGDVDTINGFINAGTYIVTVSSTYGITKVDKEGYDLQSKSFLMTVAKKQITAGMFLINPKTYNNGGSLSINPETDVIAKDTAVKSEDGTVYGTPKVVKAGGTSSASAIGTYSIDLQVDEKESPNYTGKVSVKWHIVDTGRYMRELAFEDAKTTIYNNGMIHFEVNRPDDTQFENGVARFGVIIEKKGQLDAPAVNTADIDGGKTAATQKGNYPRKRTADAKDQFDQAYKTLQLGNGLTEGQQSDKLKAENPTKYGANIKVVDVETGAWFRPYVVDGKGKIYYGDVIYVNLVQEATEQLNLKMADTQAADSKVVVTKDDAKANVSASSLETKKWREDVTIGYSGKKAQYYVYGSYTLAADSNVKPDAVQAFGVVVDKTGAFSSAQTEANKKKVKDGLKIGKGFIEGKGGSNKMDFDEYGALINPKDSVTGVWVRCYVNLGNNLVVYTDPVYIESQSEIYKNDAKVKVKLTKQNDQVKAVVDNNANFAGATCKYVGVVVDKTGKFLTKDAKGDYADTFAVADGDYIGGAAEAAQEMILGNGFIQGKKAYSAYTSYTAKVTPDTYAHSETNTKTNIPVVVRPYAIYSINGVDVTIYGEADKMYIAQDN